MIRRQLTINDLFLILVNLVPLYGVWFEGWNAAMVFLVYCLETVIVGVINVIKMGAVTIFVRPRESWNNQGAISKQPGWFFILFFIIHYGFFVFVQTQLFFGVSGLVKDDSIFGKYAKIPALLGQEGKLLLLVFIVFHTLQMMLGFFKTGEYKNISLARLMFQPYLRIIVQQFIVIIGSMFLSFGATDIFILVVVVVKIFFEVFINYEGFLEKAEKRTGVNEEGSTQ